MSCWGVFLLIGIGATGLGAWLTAPSYYNDERTRALMRDLAPHADERQPDTQNLMQEMQSTLVRMDARWQEAWKLVDQLLSLGRRALAVRHWDRRRLFLEGLLQELDWLELKPLGIVMHGDVPHERQARGLEEEP